MRLVTQGYYQSDRLFQKRVPSDIHSLTVRPSRRSPSQGHDPSANPAVHRSALWKLRNAELAYIEFVADVSGSSKGEADARGHDGR